MSSSPEDLLSKELAKLSGLSSTVGSLLSGQTGDALGAGIAASVGTKFAERFLPTERYSETIVVIFFEILEGDASSCEITVTGAAKEGLIKQQTAQKAVQGVVTELKRLTGGA